MKIGLDVHGVIDRYPEHFSDLSWSLKNDGHEVHIITGQECEKVMPVIDKHRIGCDKVFSIVDYHKAMGTKMWADKKGTWWMEDAIWRRSKGDYIAREKVDIHFDDEVEYANWIPDFCTFILVPKMGFDIFVNHISFLK